MLSNWSLLLPVVYRPPYSPQHQYTVTQFCDDFADFLGLLGSCNQDVIISGDFNIHYNKMENNDTKLYMEVLSYFNLQQHVSCPTHSSGNTLDHIISSKSPKTTMVLTTPSEDLIISDHSVISS
eukprot:GHVU01233532.1.p1 GENE.GHVU01233532.1~~GHVU01233532.1.p1  ORF type:complete len:124 (+),score=3.88 GHVU01233532.1:223-594(+)